MIKPINGHILIEPVTHDSFISQAKEVYDEIGVVVDFDENIMLPKMVDWDEKNIKMTVKPPIIHKGCKVYFDSWLAAKLPSGKEGEFFWVVKIEDIRAVEHES